MDVTTHCWVAVCGRRGCRGRCTPTRPACFRRRPKGFIIAARRGAQPTQIGRALGELNIEWIAAHSPQAKGRIERFFGTAQHLGCILTLKR